MITNSTSSECSQFPIRDYDALERELASMRQRLQALEPRFAAMTEQLDRITAPGPRIVPDQARVRRRGFEFRNQFFPEYSCIGIHYALIRRLWIDFPEHRDAMAAAAKQSSRSRSYVARTPDDLFDGQSAGWSRRHSRVLVEGWFIDTNMNPKQMQKILRSVVAVVGLEWEKDVKVVWRGM
jgi:hypothetical protein